MVRLVDAFPRNLNPTVGKGMTNIFTQWHENVPGRCVPPLTLYLNTEAATPGLTLRQRGGREVDECLFETHRTFDLGKVQAGRWYDFVVHVKWSSHPATGLDRGVGEREAKRLPQPRRDPLSRSRRLSQAGLLPRLVQGDQRDLPRRHASRKQLRSCRPGSDAVAHRRKDRRLNRRLVGSHEGAGQPYPGGRSLRSHLGVRRNLPAVGDQL